MMIWGFWETMKMLMRGSKDGGKLEKAVMVNKEVSKLG
jgi:hypothetical protein